MNRVQRKLAAKFAEAMARHEAGDMAAAETQYRALLADKPNHADALHMLGLLHFQPGRPEPAIDLIRKALAHHPKHAGETGTAYRRQALPPKNYSVDVRSDSARRSES